MANDIEKSGSVGLVVLLFVLCFAVAAVLDVGGLGSKLGQAFTLQPAPASQAAPASAPADAASAPAPKPAVAPELTQAWLLDASGYDGAEAERKRAGAPLVIYFQQRGCERCRAAERELFASPELKQFLGSSLKVRVDVAAGPRENALAQKFKALELPALVWVAPNGDAHLVPLERGGAWLPPDRVLANLR